MSHPVLIGFKQEHQAWPVRMWEPLREAGWEAPGQGQLLSVKNPVLDPFS